MPRVIADRQACEGYGNCVQSAPSLFEMDNDDVVVVLQDHVEDSDVVHAEEAALSCPVHAITVAAD